MKYYHLGKDFIKNKVFVILFHSFFPFTLIVLANGTVIEPVINKDPKALSKVLFYSIITIAWVLHSVGFYLDSKTESNALLDHARKSLYDFKSLRRHKQHSFTGIFLPFAMILIGGFYFATSLEPKIENLGFLILGLYIAYKIFMKRKNIPS